MFEAKTHLPKIIALTQEGEDICITNRQREVAYLISAQKYHAKKAINFFQQLNMLKKIAPLGDIDEIKSLRDEGKK